MKISIFDKCNEEDFEEEVRKAYQALCSQLVKITAEKRTILRDGELYHYSPIAKKVQRNRITSLARKEGELVAAINACIDYLGTRALR